MSEEEWGASFLFGSEGSGVPRPFVWGRQKGLRLRRRIRAGDGDRDHDKGREWNAESLTATR